MMAIMTQNKSAIFPNFLFIYYPTTQIYTAIATRVTVIIEGL